jgi:hypothetical protein
MALPPSGLFSLKKRPSEFRVAFSLYVGTVAVLFAACAGRACLHLEKPTQPVRISNEADVAQLVEQLIRNQQVNGSSPFVGSIEASLIIR